MLIIALVLMAAKLDDPTPIATKLADPPAWSSRVLPVALRVDLVASKVPAKPPAPKVPSPPIALPANEWRPFTGNPAYEVLGHEDADGVFRYTASRLKTRAYAAPVYRPVYQFGSPCANGSCPR